MIEESNPVIYRLGMEILEHESKRLGRPECEITIGVPFKFARFERTKMEFHIPMRVIIGDYEEVKKESENLIVPVMEDRVGMKVELEHKRSEAITILTGIKRRWCFSLTLIHCFLEKGPGGEGWEKSEQEDFDLTTWSSLLNRGLSIWDCERIVDYTQAKYKELIDWVPPVDVDSYGARM